MQWKWKAWLHLGFKIRENGDLKKQVLKQVLTHMPHATVHSSLVAEAWLAWHSMHRSMMWFLGIIFNIMVALNNGGKVG